MATSDRPQFLKRALKYFMNQTYLQSELIIVDDGISPMTDIVCIDNPRINYIKLDKKTPLGTKLNIGISHARGDIIQKLDDDDWYHPYFLKTAISHLLAAGTEGCIVAWDCFMIYFSGEAYARFSGHGWGAGGTLCFKRSLWNKIPFRDVSQAEDYWFKKDHEERVVKVHMPLQYMLVRHGKNTWRNAMRDGRDVDTDIRSHSGYQKPLNHFLSRGDAEFYYSLPSI